MLDEDDGPAWECTCCVKCEGTGTYYPDTYEDGSLVSGNIPYECPSCGGDGYDGEPCPEHHQAENEDGESG